jgi:phospholipase/lecithinase/hemolysin
MAQVRSLLQPQADRHQTPARQAARVGAAAFVVFALAGGAQARSVAPISQLVVFGDSLSDTGNILALTSSPLGAVIGFTPRPTSPSYLNGQFTNGPGGNAGLTATAYTNGVWHRTLAQSLGVPLAAPSGLNATTPAGNNFAWGGAQATGGSAFIPSVSTQVTRYINGRASVPNDPLYIFWGGGNDLMNAATATSATEAGVYAARDTALAAMRSSIEGLIARLDQTKPMQILWPNLPSLDRTPQGAALAPVLRLALWQASLDFAMQQQDIINQLSTQYPRLSLLKLDVYTLFNQVLDTPNAFGLTNTVDPILNTTSFASPGPFNPTLNVDPSTNPDRYVFWDSLHPTSRVHHLIGLEAARVVPGPSGVGVLALVGLLASRRRRSA